MSKVAIIYDTPGWAFHHIAIQLAMHAPKDLEFTLIPSGHPKSWRRFHQNIYGDFDWYHYLWRGATESITANGAKNISTAVYDHQFLDNLQYTHRLLRSTPFYVASTRLQNIYSNIFAERLFSACQDGVDTNLFYPHSPIGNENFLRVGWVGNSTWGHNSTKGFHEVFNSSIEIARSMGVPIETHVADASISLRSHTEMAAFYQDIDVLLCTSLTEGTPNPILEVSAAGRAWISTDVGIVAELAGPLQSEFIVERKAESFAVALQRLHLERSMLQLLGTENRAQIEASWKWSMRSQAIIEFIKSSMASNL